MERLFFECAIRAALLVAGTAIVLQVLRVKDAAAKHKVWAGVVALMLVLPLWTAWGPRAPVRVLPPLAESVSVVATAPALRDVVPDVSQSEIDIPLATAPAPPSPRWNWQEVLLGVYLLGLVALLLRLAMGAARAQRLVRRAVLLDGRLTSSACAAPVTTGWFRARVILPEQWREWPQAKLDAVLTHEGEHARRHDPLVQGLALLNRAVFWFHPAAWWLERRLSTLAEEACDDVVLARGHSPSDYSEYLMDMARAVMQSGARVNVAGLAMPGSSLPRRIRRIIDGAPVAHISRPRMACVAAACSITCAAFAAGSLDHALLRAPMRTAQQQANGVPTPVTNLPTFEFASIKVHNAGTDNRFGSRIMIRVYPSGLLTATNVTLRTLLQSAYPLTPAQGRLISGPPGEIDALRARLMEDIPGAPSWIDSARFDVEAQAQGKPNGPQMQLMLQSLLAERFKLAVHYKTDVVPVYALELVEAGRVGPQLRRHVNDGSCWDPAAEQPPTSVTGQPTLPYCGGFRITGPNNSIPENRRNVNMARVAAYLTQRLDRPVLDRTGLSGSYDFDLVIEHKPTSDYSKLFGAVQQQLGLRLVPTNGSVDVFVIDHVEMPSVDQSAQAQAGSSNDAPPPQVGQRTVLEQSATPLAETPLSALPSPDRYSLFVRNDARTLLELIAKPRGLTVEFDPAFSSRVVTVSVTKVTFEQMLDAIALEAGASWKRLTSTSIYVAPAQMTPTAGRLAFNAGSIKIVNGERNGRAGFGLRSGLLTASNDSLRGLLAVAYGLTSAQSRLISGAPEWIDSVRFDIEAATEGAPGAEQERLMEQSLLADRFKLVVRRETQVMPVYSLELADPGKTGPRLLAHTAEAKCIVRAPNTPPPPAGTALCGGTYTVTTETIARRTGNKTTMEQLASTLSGDVDRPIIDSTGLKGEFDYDLSVEYAARQSFSPFGQAGKDLSLLFEIARDQLGLKLVPTNGPVDVLVIDHVEMPSGN